MRCSVPLAFTSPRFSAVRARPQAVSQAKLGPTRPGQAKPRCRPEDGFGPACSSESQSQAARLWLLNHCRFSSFPIAFGRFLLPFSYYDCWNSGTHKCGSCSRTVTTRRQWAETVIVVTARAAGHIRGLSFDYLFDPC